MFFPLGPRGLLLFVTCWRWRWRWQVAGALVCFFVEVCSWLLDMGDMAVESFWFYALCVPATMNPPPLYVVHSATLRSSLLLEHPSTQSLPVASGVDMSAQNDEQYEQQQHQGFERS